MRFVRAFGCGAAAMRNVPAPRQLYFPGNFTCTLGAVSSFFGSDAGVAGGVIAGVGGTGMLARSASARCVHGLAASICMSCSEYFCTSVPLPASDARLER